MHHSSEKRDLSEERLLSLLKEGDYSAYHALYNRYAAGVMMRLRKLVVDPIIAEELHQEVFLQIWQQRTGLPDDIPFLSVLLHRAKINAYKFYQKASRDKKMREQLLHTASELYDQLEEHFSFKETNESLELAISKLPPQRRNIFIRIKIEGKSYEEAASEFGISLSTVKDHMTRALKFIRTELAHNNPSTFIFLILSVLFD